MSSSGTDPLPMPMECASARAAGLVAHVRAVRQVVRAESAHHQLVEERGLVRRAARGVERRGVRRGKRVQPLGDQRERVVPVDRLVVRRSGWTVHRLGQPALLAQPVVRLLGQVGDRVLGEERRGRPGAGSASSATALAPFSQNSRGAAVLGLGPRAAGAVEAVLLVDPREGQGGTPHAHLGLRHRERLADSGQPGDGTLASADLNPLVIGVLAGCSSRHLAIVARPGRDWTAALPGLSDSTKEYVDPGGRDVQAEPRASRSPPSSRSCSRP